MKLTWEGENSIMASVRWTFSRKSSMYGLNLSGSERPGCRVCKIEKLLFLLLAIVNLKNRGHYINVNKIF